MAVCTPGALLYNLLRMRFRFPGFLLLLLALPAASPAQKAASAVRVWEQQIVIPTYAVGAPELNPMFYFGRQSQGAQAPVYPYPMYDSLTGRKADKAYRIIYLENEYLKIGILPELGGRIFEGIDKTNGYNFIYRQHVIKPALISIIGAWISGGVEWNIPHHHRASTLLPVQTSIEQNADGSRTVWIGELELRQRMRWAVGYTLRPGKSYLEASLRIVNRTPVENSMLCFANVAVHVDENYQVIFPPATEYGTGHSKRAFQSWPVSNAGGRAVDISWVKNHSASASVFAWNYEDDFVAGYDHGKQAGIMSVADHHVVPGKKFFTWGTGPSGRAWGDNLTDADGPYIEIMVGAYSDNQPDYSWLQPYETRSFSMSWYPFRDIGGVKKANLDAAVNLEVRNGAAAVGFYATSAHPAARVRLKAAGKVLFEQAISIAPDKPFRKEVGLPAGTAEHDLEASLWDGTRELVSYSPVRLKGEPAPKAVTPPPAPADVKTTEELYLIGLRAAQFHDPVLNPEAYWQEALRRDPSDTRVNTALGIDRFRKARYGEAEQFLRKAIDRLTDRYTSPKEAEPLYYLGATLQAQGRNEEAFAVYSKAAWSQPWKSAAYFGLAGIATGRGNLSQALDLAERALDANGSNLRAQNLKVALLRRLGRKQEALRLLATSVHRTDPLDVRAMAERWLLTRDPADDSKLTAVMTEHPATAQETAAEYLDSGLWQDGMDVLLRVARPGRQIHPMAGYYLSYFARKLGRNEEAAEFQARAMAAPPDYVFPFQNEAIPVLRAAMEANPKDPRAPYYLGNLLYDWQPEEAARMWTASVALDPLFAIAHRNLAVAYAHAEAAPDLARAIAALETAVGLERKYALHFAELDDLYEQVGTPLEKRLPLFEKNAAVVAQRDDAENRMIGLMVALGKYDEAIGIMTGRKFAVAEGANLNVAEHWADAHVLRARQRIRAGQFAQALEDLKAAATVPPNLPGTGGRANAEAAYWTGAAYEGLGDRARAIEACRSAGASGGRGVGSRLSLLPGIMCAETW